MQNSCRIRRKVASRSVCDAILSRSLFSSSTFADVDLRQSPSCLTLTARGRAAIHTDTDLERCSEGVFVLERTEQIVKPTPSQPSPLCLERQRIIDSVCVCVCVCLMSDWLGRGLGSWEPLKPPLEEPPRTLHTFPDALSLPHSAPTRPGVAGSGWLSATSATVSRGN